MWLFNFENKSNWLLRPLSQPNSSHTQPQQSVALTRPGRTTQLILNYSYVYCLTQNHEDDNQT